MATGSAYSLSSYSLETGTAPTRAPTRKPPARRYETQALIASTTWLGEAMNQFAVLQLSGCAGCEVSLLNAEAWVDRYKLVYMPLVISAYDVPEVDVLLVSGGVRTDEDLYNLRRAVRRAHQVVAVGTCAISGGVASLGDRDEVRELFLVEEGRRHVPRLLPRCRPIDAFVTVDRYLPGCPPTPELFMAVLFNPPDFKTSRIVCQECGRKKLKDMRPTRLIGFQRGEVLPDICLINQGYLCIGSSTRGGCRAPCPRAGHPCVGCRGPSDALIEKESSTWFASIQRVFAAMTDIPPEEVEATLRSPQLALFLFQFSDYASPGRPPRPKEKVL
jgi:F420-non-reducing hydrogenase small subunit